MTTPIPTGSADWGEAVFAPVPLVIPVPTAGASSLVRSALATMATILPAVAVPAPIDLTKFVFTANTTPASEVLQPFSLTVSAWIEATAAQDNFPAFVSYGLDSVPFESYILQAHSINGKGVANFYFLTGSGVGHYLDGVTKLAPNTSYKLDATYSAETGVACLYLNGSLESTLTVSPAFPIYYPAINPGLAIGKKAVSTANGFTGELIVSLYSSALTAAQIASLYSETLLANAEATLNAALAFLG